MYFSENVPKSCFNSYGFCVCHEMTNLESSKSIEVWRKKSFKINVLYVRKENEI